MIGWKFTACIWLPWQPSFCLNLRAHTSLHLPYILGLRTICGCGDGMKNVENHVFPKISLCNHLKVVLHPWLKGIVSDSNSIFLWYKSEDINKKMYFQNFSWFQFYVYKLYMIYVNSSKKWLHNWICYPSNRSKQETHMPYTVKVEIFALH